MSATLPSRPSLEFLRKQAKDLLRAHRQGRPDACALLRHLHRFRSASNVEILASSLALHEVQFALALDYGFATWHVLKAHVECRNTSPAPHLASVKLTYHPSTQDSFSLVLSKAAELLGIPADYQTILALSTNAFAPAIDPGEDCAAWWHMAGRDIASDTAAAALGLEMVPLPLPDLGLRYGLTAEQTATLQLRQRSLCNPILRQAMTDGAVVITDGGWELKGLHGFVPWTWWGILTDARDDAAPLGATLNGHADNPLHHLQSCWAVRLRGAETANVATNALRRAVARIRGDQPPFSGNRLRFGLSAMDLWIERMKEVPGFCAPCTAKSKRGWVCACTNARASHHFALGAAEWLRRELLDWPDAGQTQLTHAADAYAGIVSLFAPFLHDQSPCYELLIGDITLQRRHAQDVLVPVRNYLRNAATAIEQALDGVGAAELSSRPP